MWGAREALMRVFVAYPTFGLGEKSCIPPLDFRALWHAEKSSKPGREDWWSVPPPPGFR